MAPRTMVLAIGSVVLVFFALHGAPAWSGAPAGGEPICDPGGPYPCISTIRFDGTRSYDPDGVIVSYAWDFGDGQTGTGGIVTHHYLSAGTYEVSLTVVDNSQLSSTCQITIEVVEPCPGNCPPVCNAAGPYQGITGEPILFDGTGSSSPNTCLLVLYAWEFGDGATGVGPQPSHTYAATGVYVVELTVTDYEGASSTCTTTVEIVDPSAVEPATWGQVKHRMED